MLELLNKVVYGLEVLYNTPEAMRMMGFALFIIMIAVYMSIDNRKMRA